MRSEKEHRPMEVWSIDYLVSEEDSVEPLISDEISTSTA